MTRRKTRQELCDRIAVLENAVAELRTFLTLSVKELPDDRLATQMFVEGYAQCQRDALKYLPPES